MQRMVSFIVVELVVKAVIWNIFSSGRLVLANPRRELLRWKRKASRGVLAHSRRARESPSLASSRTVVPERYHVPGVQRNVTYDPSTGSTKIGQWRGTLAELTESNPRIDFHNTELRR